MAIWQLSNRWNTRIVVKTKQEMESSEMITFKRGLPQGDAFCPRLFTLYLNPITLKAQTIQRVQVVKTRRGVTQSSKMRKSMPQSYN